MTTSKETLWPPTDWPVLEARAPQPETRWSSGGDGLPASEAGYLLTWMCNAELKRREHLADRMSQTRGFAIILTAILSLLAFEQAGQVHSTLLVALFVNGLFLFREAEMLREWARSTHRLESLLDMLRGAVLDPHELGRSLGRTVGTEASPMALGPALRHKLRGGYAWHGAVIGGVWALALVRHSGGAVVRSALLAHPAPLLMGGFLLGGLLLVGATTLLLTSDGRLPASDGPWDSVSW